jgi:sphinganine-1-phosphate aldolase
LTASSLRNVIFILFLLRWTKKSFYVLRGHGLFGSLSLAYSRIYKSIYRLLLRTPGVRSQVDKQVATAIIGIENKLAPQGPGVTRYLTIPKEPWTSDQLRSELGQLAEMKRARWEDGKVSGAVYHGGEELLRLQATAMEMFGVANPIHPDVFPGVRKMEAEVVAMVRMGQTISWRANVLTED